jgi:hypothetical protein
MAEVNPHLPYELDSRDPNFAREMLEWSEQTRREIQEVLASTRRTIATTRVLIAEADLILARK